MSVLVSMEEINFYMQITYTMVKLYSLTTYRRKGKMAKKEDLESKVAKQGEKMIEVKLRFWTNDIADKPGNVIPKHAWTGGVVRVERNKSHGIEPSKPVPFHSLLDVGAVIEKVLISHGIKLHINNKMKKYMEQ